MHEHDPEKRAQMNIYFVESEPLEQQFFAEELQGHNVRFADDLSEVGEDAGVLSVFIYSQVDAQFLDAHPRLKFVTTRSTGYDHIDLVECAKRGVAVASVPSYGENTVAEHAFALILALSRRLRESFETNKKSRFSYEAIRGFDLKGKTLGVIGCGRIGLHMIRIARGFEMEARAYDLHKMALVAEVAGFSYVSLDELLACSDIISLHIPLSPETRHLINRDTLSKCKHGALIINTARGQLIDTAALIEALDSGKIGGAGLDVLEDERVLQHDSESVIGKQIISTLQHIGSGSARTELRQDPARVRELQTLMQNTRLISQPNVVFTPHSAFNSVEAVERINRTTIRNIRRFLKGASGNVIMPKNTPPENSL